MSWQFSAEQARQLAAMARDWQRYGRDLVALLSRQPSRQASPARFGFGYTTTACSTSGNVATVGALKVCAWAYTSATTRTFTDLGGGPQPCITPDPAGMPANKRVWWRRDVLSGIIVIDGALCPLTTSDPAPATAAAVATQNGTQVAMQNNQPVSMQ